MKKFFTTILFSVIAVVSFGQAKSFTIIDNNVYEISHNESGQKIYTELGALDNNAISFSNNKVPNYKTGWKFAKSVGLDYSYALTEYNDIVTIHSIGAFVGVGARYNNYIYVGGGSGYINTITVGNSDYEWKGGRVHSTSMIPVYAEMTLNTKSKTKLNAFVNTKIGADILIPTGDTETTASFAMRTSVGMMISNKVTIGATYTMHAKKKVTHGIGANISFVF